MEVIEINKFDVGIMPLYSTPWELGKCSFKLIQYMGCSVAVLASPVGMNNEVVLNNYNGYLVEDGKWFSYIEKYILDIGLAEAHGLNGKCLIDKSFNLKHNLSILIENFKKQTD